MNPLLKRPLQRFLKATFLRSLVFSLPVYVGLRLVFYGMDFSPLEDLRILSNYIGTGWLLTTLPALAGVPFLRWTRLFMKSRVQKNRRTWVQTALVVLLLAGFLYSCQAQPTGTQRQSGTGLVTQWRGITTAKSRVVMNKEVLGHRDIPLGESFEIINTGVKGLVAKNGKVSVGCALTITDPKGNVLMAEQDLFAGADIFDARQLDYLRCTVNTGKPMDWEQTYKVQVQFWDKFGKGVLTNTLMIRIIDLP
ncbi:hypothetical protein LQ567_14885 [Niabella pedocola]|uniref:Uncharacterized protein n=1 Tax=Niabella pedocola TaxID=1752077 RepID=A0ABS8PSM0_9BACT|nr:hypothetical protein [Niabella pedocola]MCD2424062.1 hypothetical protein [Niabella pedocola]